MRWQPEHVALGLGTGTRPHMIMSLLVTPKAGKPKNIRLIHDCGTLNKLLEKWAFTTERLKDFVKELSELDLFSSVDIQSAYHHVEFTAITSSALRRSGLATVLITFADDSGGSIGKQPDRRCVDAILDLIPSFGWVLVLEKIFDSMVHRLQLLGFTLDTTTMTIGAPAPRQEKLQLTATHVLHFSQGLPARSFCKLIGQIVSMPALGLICRLRSRYLMLAVRDAAGAGDYNMCVSITWRALDELAFWRDKLTTLREAPMYTHLRQPDFVLECGASDQALGAMLVSSPSGMEASVTAFKSHRRLLPDEILRR
jgi:hypothetical protein